MTDPHRSVSPAELKNMLHDGAEIALLDVREAGQFGESHLLFATPLPYSRLALDAFRARAHASFCATMATPESRQELQPNCRPWATPMSRC